MIAGQISREQVSDPSIRDAARGGPPPWPIYSIAETLEDVTDAWKLLYQSYLRAGYIKANPFGIHTVPQAIGPNVLVVRAQVQGVTVSTITAMVDGPEGLPLDSVYHDELNELRQQGTALMEVGLFGDRRDIASDHGDRTFIAVFELMRFTFSFGRTQGVNFVCGIPPRRSRLYGRTFGFLPVGPARAYSTVEDNPVQLMWASTAQSIENASDHRAIDYFLKNAVPSEAFARRFQFDPQAMAGSDLERYLLHKQESDH